MALKVVFFFNQATRGWTETYYSNSGSTPYQFIQTIPANVYQAAIAFRAPLTQLYAVRASNIGSPRSSYASVLVSAEYFGQAVSVADNPGPEVASTDAVFRYTSAVGTTKIVMMRGLAEIDVSRSATGFDLLTTQLNKGVVKFFNTLGAAGLGMRNQDRPPNKGLVWYPVVTVQGTNNTTFLGTYTATGYTLTPDTQVVFQGIPRDDLPGFPKQCAVISQTSAAPFGITIPYRERVQIGETPYYPAKLKFTLVSYTYNAITSITFIRFSERKTGRPFGVPRGRQKSQVTRF